MSNNYARTLGIIADMQIAVLMNPLSDPSRTVNRAAGEILRTYTVPPGMCGAMLESLAVSKRAYPALMAGVKKLEGKA